MDRGHSLYVIRHFPTEGNEKKQYIGWTNEPIIPLEMNPLSIDVSTVYGSDLLRAKQTAKIYFPNASYSADERLRECHFGAFEGKTYTELETDQQYRNWIGDPHRYAPTGGESLKEMRLRVVEALRSLPNEAFAVTHGGPIRMMMAQFAPEEKPFWSWIVPHGSIWKFRWKNQADLEEGRRCMSLSEVRITENGHMSEN